MYHYETDDRQLDELAATQPRSVTIASYAAIALAILAIVLMVVLWFAGRGTSDLEREFGVSLDEARADLTVLEEDVDSLDGRVDSLPDGPIDREGASGSQPVLVPIPTPVPTPTPTPAPAPTPAEPAPDPTAPEVAAEP
jgi:hypothetical protein